MSRLLFLRHPEPGEPTQAKKDAGTYRKRRLAWKGLTLMVENEAGTFRRGIGGDGTRWETLLMWSYGYVARTEGVDGDEVDVYLGPHIEDAPMVYVVHQRCYGDWSKYDEDKAMLGFMSEGEARDAFLACYDDPRFLGPITAMPVAEFVLKVRATKEAPAMIKSEPVVLFAKAHVQGYTKRDGTVVKPHDDGRRAKPAKPAADAPLLAFGAKKPNNYQARKRAWKDVGDKMYAKPDFPSTPDQIEVSRPKAAAAIHNAGKKRDLEALKAQIRDAEGQVKPHSHPVDQQVVDYAKRMYAYVVALGQHEDDQARQAKPKS